MNKLNKTFVQKGPKLAAKLPHTVRHSSNFLKKRVDTSMKFEKITENELLNLITDLNPGKAAGHDDKSAIILKWCLPFICAPLLSIFNAFLDQGTYPTVFKLAKVTALFKGGIESDADNYRPILVLHIK